MSAFGSVVIKATEELNSRLSDSDDYDQVFSDLLQFSGLEPSFAKNVGYGFEDSKMDSGYICLDAFDSGWLELAQYISKNGKNIELYASLGDEYGTKLVCALNSKGERFQFSYEEESDEWDQDDFDEDSFNEELEAKLKEWNSLIPDAVKESFPDLVETEAEEDF